MAIRRQDLNRLLQPLISLPDVSQTVSHQPVSPKKTALETSADLESTSAGAVGQAPKEKKTNKRKQTDNKASRPAKRRKKESVTIDNFI